MSDEPSLSDRAASFTREWNAQVTTDRANYQPPANGRAATGGGGSIGTVGILTMVAMFGAVVGLMFAEDHFISSALLSAVIFVVLALLVWVVFRLLGFALGLGVKGSAATGRAVGRVVGGVMSGLPGALIRGTLFGAAAGAVLVSFLGDDIPLTEGVWRFAPVGMVVGALYHLATRRRRRG